MKTETYFAIIEQGYNKFTLSKIISTGTDVLRSNSRRNYLFFDEGSCKICDSIIHPFPVNRRRKPISYDEFISLLDDIGYEYNPKQDNITTKISKL